MNSPLPRLVVATPVDFHADPELILMTREPNLVDGVLEVYHDDRRILVRPDSLRELYDPTTHEAIEHATPRDARLPDAPLSYRLEMVLRVTDLIDLLGCMSELDEDAVCEQTRAEIRRIITPSPTISRNPFDTRSMFVFQAWSHDELTKTLNRGAELAHADVVWSPEIQRPVTTTTAVLNLRQEIIVRMTALRAIIADLEESTETQPWADSIAAEVRAVADPDRPMSGGRFAAPMLLDQARTAMRFTEAKKSAVALDQALAYADVLERNVPDGDEVLRVFESIVHGHPTHAIPASEPTWVAKISSGRGGVR